MLKILGLIGALLISIILVPLGYVAMKYPDKDFDFKVATYDEKVEWLRSYGNFIETLMSAAMFATGSGEKLEFSFISVDPVEESAHFSVGSSENLNLQGTAEERKILKTLFIKSTCKENLADKIFMSNVKLRFKLFPNNIDNLNVLLTKEICEDVNRRFGES